MHIQNQLPKLIVAGAFLIKEGNVLLALRKNTFSDNSYYGLIGGKIDHGEAIHAGLLREIKEETGIIVQSEDMTLIHVMSFKKNDGTEIISFDFIITQWRGDPVNLEPHKHTTLEWFPLNNLPTNIIDRHKNAYELHLKNINYSHYGW